MTVGRWKEIYYEIREKGRETHFADIWQQDTKKKKSYKLAVISCDSLKLKTSYQLTSVLLCVWVKFTVNVLVETKATLKWPLAWPDSIKSIPHRDSATSKTYELYVYNLVKINSADLFSKWPWAWPDEVKLIQRSQFTYRQIEWIHVFILTVDLTLKWPWPDRVQPSWDSANSRTYK